MTSTVIADIQVKNYIGGEWVPGSSGESLEVVNPSTGQVITRFAASSTADVDKAVEAARSAQPAWAARTPGERSQLLHELVDAVRANVEDLVHLEVIDAGKPITAAREEEFPAILDALRHFAGAARTLSGQAAGEYASNTTTLVRREPLGVIAGITPWNYPLWQAVWKIVPALAAGNTVVIKPAESTPLSTARFVEIAGGILPTGVLNLVNGRGADVGDYLSRHPGINLVSFTGSTATGRAIAHATAEGPKRALLELGGNAPVVVLDDADLEETAATIVSAGLYNAGQECMAATRVIVSEKVAEALVEKVIGHLKDVVVGGTEEEATVLGPLISERQRDRVEGLLQRRPNTSRIAFGGGRPDLPGYFLEPTLVTGLEQEDELVQEEIFGPVITVQTFAEDSEALTMANGVAFGLAGSVWTQNIERGLRFVNALNFGNVWINTHLVVGPDYPIGGFNESGYGKEGGGTGIEEFTRIKQVGIKLGNW
ncbi:aldehyde dehydrogenase family protein [Paenarthrobacter sp. NPDC092416]|uniref:aldehyde dehydrogenase family protein n=1 Tax=Paenarthrobacter sp. NPDC092416 TaxID=3364386 RepID=UPI00380C46CA